MSKIDLSSYSDKEIVAAFFSLPAGKFLAVMNAMSAISQKMERRGKLIAQESSDEVIDSLIRQLFEDKE